MPFLQNSINVINDMCLLTLIARIIFLDTLNDLDKKVFKQDVDTLSYRTVHVYYK